MKDREERLLLLESESLRRVIEKERLRSKENKFA